MIPMMVSHTNCIMLQKTTMNGGGLVCDVCSVSGACRDPRGSEPLLPPSVNGPSPRSAKAHLIKGNTVS